MKKSVCEAKSVSSPCGTRMMVWIKETTAGGTVGTQANNVLFSIRDLAVGRQAPDIEGETRTASISS